MAFWSLMMKAEKTGVSLKSIWLYSRYLSEKVTGMGSGRLVTSRLNRKL